MNPKHDLGRRDTCPSDARQSQSVSAWLASDAQIGQHVFAARRQPTDLVRQHQLFAFGSLLCLTRKHRQLLFAMSSATQLSLPFGTCHDSSPSSGCSKKWDQEFKATTTNGMVARGLPDPDRSIGCHRTYARGLVDENSGSQPEGQRFPGRRPPWNTSSTPVTSRVFEIAESRCGSFPPWLFNR